MFDMFSNGIKIIHTSIHRIIVLNIIIHFIFPSINPLVINIKKFISLKIRGYWTSKIFVICGGGESRKLIDIKSA